MDVELRSLEESESMDSMEEQEKAQIEAIVMAAVRSQVGPHVGITGFLRLELAGHPAPREVCVSLGEAASASAVSAGAPRLHRRKAFVPRRVIAADLASAEEQEAKEELLPLTPALQLPTRAHRMKRASSGRAQRRQFDCNQCGQEFRSLSLLNEHTHQAHGSYRCSECDSKFTQRSNLIRHGAKHLPYRPFRCGVCEREYDRKDHLVRHIELTHKVLTPRECVVHVQPPDSPLQTRPNPTNSPVHTSPTITNSPVQISPTTTNSPATSEETTAVATANLPILLRTLHDVQ